MIRDIPHPYDAIYLLKPVHQTEPGWWKLKWRPLWRQTFSIYRSSMPLLGLYWYRTDARNGWGRSYNHFTINFGLGFVSWSFWIRWNFVVHSDGPSDLNPRRPITVAVLEHERGAGGGKRPAH